MKKLKIYQNYSNKNNSFTKSILNTLSQVKNAENWFFFTPLGGRGNRKKHLIGNGIKIYSIFSLLIVLLGSCEKVNLKTSDNNVAVVEAYIEPGDSLAVKIKRQITFEEGENNNLFIEGLVVSVQIDGQETVLQYVNDSIYTSMQLTIDAGDEVSLSFEYNNLTITSQSEIPTKPSGFSLSPSSIEISTEMGPGSGGDDLIEIEWDNPDADYHMLVVENIEDDPELIREEDDDRPPRSFRNEPTQGESQEIRGMGFTYYGRHRVVLFKLNPEYAALYEDLNTTSLDLTAPPSNITNGLGIFTGINSDTLYINVNAAK